MKNKTDIQTKNQQIDKMLQEQYDAETKILESALLNAAGKTSWDEFPEESEEKVRAGYDRLITRLRETGDFNEAARAEKTGSTRAAKEKLESLEYDWNRTHKILKSAAPAAADKRKKGGRYVPSGIAFVQATFNNTKVTFTDLHGNVLCWSTGGKNGFKGSRKSTAYAAQVVAADAAKKAEALGMKEVEVRIKGPGAGRESAVRGIASTGMEVNAIKDITPVPHNGCRPPKRRRV